MDGSALLQRNGAVYTYDFVYDFVYESMYKVCCQGCLAIEFANDSF
jgi:hypothetical protein